MFSYFRNNLGFRLISIFAAILLWFFVFSERNPTIEDVVVVPLEMFDLSKELVASDKPGTVNIRFQGKSNVISKISSRDFRAYLSLEDAGIGSKSVEVQADYPPGIRIVSIQPTRVEIGIDQVSSVQLPVEVVIQGEVAKGYILEKTIPNPNQVIIKGPANYLEDIGRVYIEGNVSNLTQSSLQSLPVAVEDKTGALIMEWVEIIPAKVDLLIPVIEDKPSKIVPLILETTGELPPNLKLKSMLSYPSTIKIYGENDFLNKTGYLSLKVDLNEVKESTILDVSFVLPPGITIAGKNTAQVIVEVGK